jgi:hypothetical protein
MPSYRPRVTCVKTENTMITARALPIAALLFVALTANVVTAPSAPTLNAPQVSGSTVTLAWTLPAGATAIRLEAGTAPGLSNAANTIIGATTTFTTGGVPPGTYFVRVRAIDATGESAASNEITVIVGSGGGGTCASPPAAPTELQATVAGTAVSISWIPAGSGCPAASFILYGGSAPGLTDLATVSTPAAGLAALAPPGTYYVFVVAQNASGVSGPSNLITVNVGGGPVPGAGTIAAGQWTVNGDIAPGRYFTDPRPNCYWERQGAAGVIASELIEDDQAQRIVEILPTDVGFSTSEECGTWSSAPPRAPGGIPLGVWLVGGQIQPGTYGVNAAPGCYWARLRDFFQSPNSVIEADFNPSASTQVVTIEESDAGFQNDRCGIWVRIGEVRAAVRKP